MMKIRVRVIVGVMIFFGYFMIYVTRYNLSVHIVDMVERPWAITRERNTAKFISSKRMDEMIPKQRSGNIIDLMYWSDSKISLILAAYHIGYVICFPIIHNFGDRYGPKWVVGVSGFLSGLLSCLTPASAYYSYWLMFFFRVLIGFCAGAMQPSMVQVLRHWMPPTERPYFMWAYCGTTLGTCCTFLICALVQYYASWSIGFHIYGAFQIAWAIVWLLVVTDSPQKHYFISEEELTYLSTTICNVFAIKLSNLQAPWRLILKSMSFWMLCILSFSYSWIIISVCLHGPMYYSKILQYSIYEASALTALPFLLRLILGTTTIHVYYWYKNNTRIKKNKNIRKYFIFVSHVIPGGLLSLAWCLSINPGPYLLTIALAFTAAGMDLTLDICYELSPNYLNSVCTVIKIISNIPGIIVPLCVGEVVLLYKDEMRAWKGIWGFDGTFLLVSGLIFLVWGRIEIQPWNDIRLRRPQRKLVPTIRPSTMSNIIEGEEEDNSVQSSIQGRSQLPQLFRSLRLSN